MQQVAARPSSQLQPDTATTVDTARLELHVKEQEVQQLRETALKALEHQVCAPSCGVTAWL
jgi:hypothetical protein